MRFEFQKEFLNRIQSSSTGPADFIPCGRLSAQEALRVYQDGYLARLTEALGETYETVWRVLGDEDFFKTCRHYILSHPSQTYNLNLYGERFHELLEGFLAQVARLEWLYQEVFHSAQHIPCELEKFNQSLESKKDFVLSFGPSFRLFASPVSIYSLWRRRQEECLDLSKVLSEESEWLMFYRYAHQTYSKKISNLTFDFFKALLDGESFLNATQKTFSNCTEQEALSLLPEAINLLIQTQVITSVACLANIHPVQVSHDQDESLQSDNPVLV